MAASKEFIEHVLDLLEPLERLHTSKMFGGVLLKVGEKQLGIISGSDTFYFKVTNPKLQAKFKSEGSKQFSYTRKDKKEPILIKNWWSAPDRVIDSSREMMNLVKKVLNQ